jgi:hypothetical protein
LIASFKKERDHKRMRLKAKKRRTNWLILVLRKEEA